MAVSVRLYRNITRLAELKCKYVKNVLNTNTLLPMLDEIEEILEDDSIPQKHRNCSLHNLYLQRTWLLNGIEYVNNYVVLEVTNNFLNGCFEVMIRLGSAVECFMWWEKFVDYYLSEFSFIRNSTWVEPVVLDLASLLCAYLLRVYECLEGLFGIEGIERLTELSKFSLECRELQ